MDADLQNLIKDLNIQQFREAVVNTVDLNEDVQMVVGPDIDNIDMNIDEWRQKMASDRFWVDHAFIQLCSNFIKRDIMILPIYPEDGHNGKGWIKISAKENAGKIYLLCYMNIHFQSIVPYTKSLFGQAIGETSEKPRKRPRRQ